MYDPRQIVGDLVRRQRIAVETEIHRVDGLTDLDGEHRLLRSDWQLIEHRGDFGVDLGKGLVGIVVEPQVDRDGRGAALAGRRHIIDAIGLSDRNLERRGDETRHEVGIGAVISRGNGHHRIFSARILQHRQRVIGAHAEDEDQQADGRGENWPANKDVGEIHDNRLLPVDRNGRRVRRRRNRIIDQNHRTVVQLDLAGGHDPVAVLHTLQHGDLIAARRPDDNEGLTRGQLRRAVGVVAFLTRQRKPCRRTDYR